MPRRCYSLKRARTSILTPLTAICNPPQSVKSRKSAVLRKKYGEFTMSGNVFFDTDRRIGQLSATAHERAIDH